MPQRLQRSRRKGYRKPAGAVSVSRPSKWGNPYVLGRTGDARHWTGWYVGEIGDEWANHGSYPTEAEAAVRAVELYRLHTGPMGNHELDVEEVRRELGGKDLVCWCPLNRPCHADVLLEIANGVSS
jgi:hypothetical protein